MNDVELKAKFEALPPEAKEIYRRWSEAHDEFRDASLAASKTRDDWTGLFDAFALKAKAHLDEAAAQRRIRDGARALNIATLPLAAEVLAPARAEAEGIAHARLKRAKQTLAEAEQRLQQVKGGH